ncbi:carbon-nitrogen hydrolase family protein [Halomonas sp. BC04]|uniref:carbon-nitrogen hydrolase family protein n=1 Tax=Halomonas sp. BC04 TaxID=1403540 RepID=UPI0003ED6574|nr:carbon-nitrogen hydrolase family protein [Halomonas sp. BC04]EWH00274.1 hypothetical protein Q427_20320 [Halomonas sp. BC04]
MSYFTIAGVQMHALHHGDNTEAMRHRVDVLMSRFPQVQMVLFSELMPLGASPHHAQPMPSTAEAMFCQLAEQHRIWLIPGSMFERVGESVYNTLSVINPHGHVVARYRKQFPFLPYEAGVESGSEFVTFDVPTWAASGCRSATTCGFPRPPAPWRPWARR